MNHRVSRNFSRDEVRNAVIPAYMGLIKQIDDQMGRLFQHLEDRGIADQTLIVFTSDHGDYLGDHWLGEKELFHDESVRVPLIIYDPSPEAKATRGTINDDLIEAIDLAPTFLEMYGGAAIPHIMDGHSLMETLSGTRESDRQRYVISEYDYSFVEPCIALDMPARDWLKHLAGLGKIPEDKLGSEVAIIGARMAGMVAAYKLMKMGLKPVIYESRRIGGRLHSEPFKGALP